MRAYVESAYPDDRIYIVNAAVRLGKEHGLPKLPLEDILGKIDDGLCGGRLWVAKIKGTEQYSGFLYAAEITDWQSGQTHWIAEVIHVEPDCRRKSDTYTKLLHRFVWGADQAGYKPLFLLDVKYNVCENTLNRVGLFRTHELYSGE